MNPPTITMTEMNEVIPKTDRRGRLRYTPEQKTGAYRGLRQLTAAGWSIHPASYRILA
jgi:hypothetical protein